MSFLDSLQAGLSIVSSIEVFLALFAGVCIGVVGGAIPGLSATMAVALTLPFTFTMQPITGILLLLGVYKGGIFGGSIPAILIKTPGTPASSATILDGHPMAERGEAGRALGMALWASCTADLVSNLALILFAGWLASFALNFGPPEFFALILFSLTIIAGVSGESLLRGALSALLGLLLATIGLDLVYGTNRFTFGNPNMMGGLNFIAVLIGLFAIPEIIAMAWNPKAHLGNARALGQTKVRLADYRPMMFVLNVDIIYGLFIGLIISSVFLFIVGSVAIRGFRFVADVPKPLLMPAVLILCIFGVFAVNNNIFDVGVMFVMGWVGFMMMRYQIPAAPFLIAFILGPLLEDNFRQSMLMSGSDPAILLRGPITWFFWTVTAITVFAIARNLRKSSTA